MTEYWRGTQNNEILHTGYPTQQKHFTAKLSISLAITSKLQEESKLVLHL